MSSGGSLSTVISAKKKWISSERIAHEILENLGYRVIETRKKIVINGVEVGEIDVVATDSSGNIYAVEIKAGRTDVTGVRQAYVNALLLNAKPLVISKGFADDAAKELAEKLGVQTVQLSDIFLVESEELNMIVKDAVEETLADYFELFYGFSPNIKPEHIELFNAICTTSSLAEAAEKLGIDIQSLTKKLDELKRAGVIPRWARRYNSIKRVAQILIQKQNILNMIEEGKKINEVLKNMLELLKQFQNTLSLLNHQLQRLSLYASKLGVDLEKNEKVE